MSEILTINKEENNNEEFLIRMTLLQAFFRGMRWHDYTDDETLTFISNITKKLQQEIQELRKK